jgi:hypothetical protein
MDIPLFKLVYTPLKVKRQRRQRLVDLALVFALATLGLFFSTSEIVAQDTMQSSEEAVPPSNPSWKFLVLIYESVDFTFTDSAGGVHRFVSNMTQQEKDRAVAAATRFVETDIPQLTSGNMVPELTIRFPDRVVTELEQHGQGSWVPGGLCYWLGPSNALPDRDPAFDSVFVIWQPDGTDPGTGQSFSIACFGGLTWNMGQGQTYASAMMRAVSANQQNVLKHEWGHSILFYYDAAGTAPKPAVSNHFDVFDMPYVHCPTGEEYTLLDEDGNDLPDETNDNPIPNGVYNNDRGFTHDYYSGTTALREDPTRCLGITPEAWASGGPVTKPLTEPPENDDFADAVELSGLVGSTLERSFDATLEPGEPQHAGVPGGASVWWQWTAPSDGQTTFDTFGSDFDTVLAVYTGDVVDALTVIAYNDDTDSLQSRVDFTATAGTRYSIAVDGFAGKTGNITLSWTGPEIQVIDIDIKPGNKRNVINLREKGGIWVAVLSDTDPGSPFDPPSQVNIPNVEFGPDGAKASRYKVKDINKDRIGDLLLRFKIRETGIACGDTETTLTGETFDGKSFTGTDSIKTIGCKHKKHHHEHDDKKYQKMHHK